MFDFFAFSDGTPRRTSLGRMVEQSTVMLMASIGSLILILALFILLHENANATKGYKLRTLERQRSQLLLEQEVVNMQVAQAQSLEQIKQDKKTQVMIPVKKPIYYFEEESTVALEK